MDGPLTAEQVFISLRWRQLTSAKSACGASIRRRPNVASDPYRFSDGTIASVRSPQHRLARHDEVTSSDSTGCRPLDSRASVQDVGLAYRHAAQRGCCVETAVSSCRDADFDIAQ
mmetsp:Transcript_127096/g.301899  ORF Transcript_127096/g.301899 Transcript_127096/m.301899 type:complete len:115 (+) Transcript_127096:57-401(+)